MKENQTNDDLSQENLYALLGADRLREILTIFYQEVFADVMIGYLFEKQDQAKLIQREWEWTARFLGAKEIEYQGENLASVHQKHPIRYGHFHRRNQILLKVLRRLQVDQKIIDFWMDHQKRMESTILGKAHGDVDCNQTANEKT
jgi:truncated hemoglobin YjbI